MRCGYHRSREGFTLVEIIVVMAVLAILTAIVLRTQDGVRERALISRANGELVMLSQVLEDYRSRYGDYPWLRGGQSGERILWEAVSGQRLPDGSLINPQSRKSWLGELAGFQFGDSTGEVIDALPGDEALAGADILILDPWNQPYQYHYRASSSSSDPWEPTGFILLSLGPSGGRALEEGLVEPSHVPATGRLPLSYPEDDDTFDNILAP